MDVKVGLHVIFFPTFDSPLVHKNTHRAGSQMKNITDSIMMHSYISGSIVTPYEISDGIVVPFGIIISIDRARSR